MAFMDVLLVDVNYPREQIVYNFMAILIAALKG